VTTDDGRPDRALAIYAHPDDTEVAAGGTLAAWADAGAEVRVVICTRGEKGTDDPGCDPDALAARRADEVAAGAHELGLSGWEILGYPDGEIGNTVELRGELVARIRSFRPDVVLSHDPTSVYFGQGYVSHHDHRSVGWAVLDACAPASASPLYYPDAGPPHQVATVLLSGTLEPDHFVDIEGSLDAKVRALLCHATQVDEHGTELSDAVTKRATETGRSAGLRQAEAFRLLRFA
jgi:LmbE family N-acetylglucosaminyl deacetylase